MQVIALGVQRERDYQNLPCATSKKFLFNLNAQKPGLKQQSNPCCFLHEKWLSTAAVLDERGESNK